MYRNTLLYYLSFITLTAVDCHLTFMTDHPISCWALKVVVISYLPHSNQVELFFYFYFYFFAQPKFTKHWYIDTCSNSKFPAERARRQRLHYPHHVRVIYVQPQWFPEMFTVRYDKVDIMTLRRRVAVTWQYQQLSRFGWPWLKSRGIVLCLDLKQRSLKLKWCCALGGIHGDCDSVALNYLFMSFWNPVFASVLEFQECFVVAFP